MKPASYLRNALVFNALIRLFIESSLDLFISALIRFQDVRSICGQTFCSYHLRVGPRSWIPS